jgi:hypothetical protein
VKRRKKLSSLFVCFLLPLLFNANKNDWMSIFKKVLLETFFTHIYTNKS